MQKLRTTLLVACVATLAVPRVANAVIDNADSLYVAAGENYTLGGVHTYNVKVRIDPTAILYVAAYTGAANTGYLDLRAPTITVSGAINGDGRGYRGLYAAAGEGPGGAPYPGGGGDSECLLRLRTGLRLLGGQPAAVGAGLLHKDLQWECEPSDLG